MNPSFTFLAPEGIPEGGILLAAYCSPKLFPGSTESEEARSLGVSYTGVFPAVEPPSAAGICNLFVAIFETCLVFASGTLEDAAGASPPSAPAAGLLLARGSAHGRRQPRVVGFREVRAGPVLSVVVRIIEVALRAAILLTQSRQIFPPPGFGQRARLVGFRREALSRRSFTHVATWVGGVALPNGRRRSSPKTPPPPVR